MFKTPNELLKAYRDGFNGSWCDPEDVAKLLGELPHPLFGAAAYGLFGTGEGKVALPFKNLLKFDPTFGPSERQVQGDCVSHATRNSVDVTRSCEIIGGQREEFVARGATEAIYGSRGHGGEGMSCSGAARFVHQTGGILLRKKYDKYDLSQYSAIGGSWGRSGVPDDLVKEAIKHQVKTISLINTVAQARDALANGYSISVCSNVGFSSRRDKYGIAKRSGSWGHAMAWIGMDDSHEIYNETLFLVQNSWGVWNGGDKRFDQPDGSFWIRQSDAEDMLSQNGSWVFSDVDGFPPRKVDWTIDEVF
ncbi:hypothetical protein EBZ38_04810 [bacterium]|nr:hypothetical protein [bacterium]NDD83590.1 hypothetical protein [bacterium]